ncbi:MAG: 2TM domain-containing protein [Proteobacteria bacterium]|jgi:hypothetical protein|nr:2TM domain-containing protein [Pseudomonadota bacterium]
MTTERRPARGAASEPVKLDPGIAAREAAEESRIERWAWRRVRALKAFYTHLTIYSIVCFAMLVIDLYTPGEPWFFYPFLGWGLAVGMHALQVYERLPWFTRDWEQRKVEELIDEARRR